ncbi:MAG: AraC family transcriptional regulator [Desulfobacteraceae bacterium]|jgi:AraC-like DNA-binding protein
MRWVNFWLLLFPVFLVGCFEKPIQGDQAITNWKVCYSQNPDYDTVHHNGPWFEKDVTRLFRLPYGKSGQSKPVQFVWLKAEFSVDHPEQVAGISLGRIYNTDRVYVNGKFCGGREFEDIQELHYPRNYDILPGVLTKGSNEILIYLGICGNEFGGFKGPVKLLSQKSFKRDKAIDSLLFLHIPIGIIAMLLGFFVNVLVYHVPEEKGYPVYVVVGILMTWIIHFILIFSPVQPFGLETRIIILWVCSFVSSMLFVLFVQLNSRVLFKNLTSLFITMEMVFILWVLLGNSLMSVHNPGIIIGAVNILLTNVMILFLLIRLRAVVDQKTKVVLWLFAVIPGEVIGLDILNYLIGTRSIPYIHIYAIPFMMLLIIILHRQSRVMDRQKMKMLTLKLIELHANTDIEERKSLVTAQVKRKLDELIDHIQANFHMPLTRENLAEKIELSPDYLGRMFKVHTGKKINDYINDLRIQEACRLLRESDEKIIDIAFTVGFESLATFNRAFMKSMNLSPTEYRQSSLENARTPGPGKNLS